MTRRHNKTLPRSGHEIPAELPFTEMEMFLREAGINSERTERAYRAGLRAFADWLQVNGRHDTDIDTPWPLSPILLTTADVLAFRSWLLSNRSQATTTTYVAAVMSYLHFLDGLDLCPDGVQLGKLAQHRKRRRIERNPAATVVDKDEARQGMPTIVAYYDNLPLPAGACRAILWTISSISGKDNSCTGWVRAIVLRSLKVCWVA